ncbi:FapA family protein, partial [Planococcus sp. SIMBA_143]
MAEKDIFVENSILHSTCAAGEKVYCQKGNIIGGSVSAGKSVEAMDVGNRLHIKTEISLGINKLAMEKEQVLVTKKKELEDEIAKLSILGKMMKNTSLTTSDAKLRITKLR